MNPNEFNWILSIPNFHDDLDTNSKLAKCSEEKLNQPTERDEEIRQGRNQREKKRSIALSQSIKNLGETVNEFNQENSEEIHKKRSKKETIDKANELLLQKLSEGRKESAEELVCLPTSYSSSISIFSSVESNSSLPDSSISSSISSSDSISMSDSNLNKNWENEFSKQKDFIDLLDNTLIKNDKIEQDLFKMLVSIRKLNPRQKEDLQKLINASDGNEEILECIEKHVDSGDDSAVDLIRNQKSITKSYEKFIGK